MLFGGLTEKLLKEKSVQRPGSSHMFVDIVKDVINLVPVYFTSLEIAGLPLKTKDTPRGIYEDGEMAEMARDVAK